MNRFENVLDTYQTARVNQLLSYFDTTMRHHGIDYVMDGGTLIGSMLHHDRIPWDDDFDVYIRTEDREQVMNALHRRKMGYVVTSNGLYSKLWSSRIPHVANHRPWNWPFLDIAWLSHNATHMWEERSKEHRYSRNVYNKSWLFPSVRRPFGPHILSAPRRAEAFLNYRFGTRWSSICVANHWNHILETWRYLDATGENTRVLCREVGVPLVRRSVYANGTSVEWLDTNRIGQPRLVFHNDSLRQSSLS